MNVTIHCLCDAANVAQGMKLNILGAFSHIWVGEEFPFRWPSMTYVARLEAESSDPTQFLVDLLIVDEDGNVVGGMQGVQGNLPGPVPAGEVFAMPLLLTISDATFSRPGTFAFELRIDGIRKASTSLFIKAKPRAAGGQ